MSKRKIHNTAPALKSKIRRRLVELLGGPVSCRVIETHSGPGVMRRGAYAGVADWLGIDQDPKSPNAIHADNREVLRAIDLSRFNLFDVDAFGAPWEQVWIIAQRRIVGEEYIGLAMTSAVQGNIVGNRATNLRAAGWSAQMETALGANRRGAQRYFAGAYASEAAQRFVGAWFTRCSVEKWLSGRSKSGNVWYFGALLRGR